MKSSRTGTLCISILTIFTKSMSNYTHIPDCSNPGSPVNRYMIVFRRATLVDPLLEAAAIEHEVVTKLIYGEVIKSKTNINEIGKKSSSC